MKMNAKWTDDVVHCGGEGATAEGSANWLHFMQTFISVKSKYYYYCYTQCEGN